MVRVGIPQALAYYQYYPMWRTFFETLGAEVVVSPPTTQKMLTDGAKRVLADTCLPAKVFMGHVLTLTDKCDYLFIPVIRSVKTKVYNCAKFLGLPDMTRAVIPGCPSILEIDFDINKGLKKIYEDIFGMCKVFPCSKNQIRKAIDLAWKVHNDYHLLMSREKLTPIQAIAGESKKSTANSLTIGVIGHHYLLYDEQINHRLIRRLEQSDCCVLTPDMLTANEIEKGAERIVDRSYWTWEEEVVGAGGCYMQQGVDGIIGIAAFGCGPDSLMMDVVRREAKQRHNVPFMNLTLEEHTAETGVITRIEAFLDMIKRRKRRLASA